MKKKEEKPKKKYFAEYIYEETVKGEPYEHFVASKKVKWSEDFRWTSAVSLKKAKQNIRAKIKDMLGYNWEKVQRVEINFGPTEREEYFKVDDKSKPKTDKKTEFDFWKRNIWTTKKEIVNVVVESHTVVKESNLFTVPIPVMDSSVANLVERYCHKYESFCLVDDQDVPLCAFAYRENANEIGSIMKVRVVRLFVDKSMWRKDG